MSSQDKDPKKDITHGEAKKDPTRSSFLDTNIGLTLADSLANTQKQFLSITQPIIDAQTQLTDLAKTISEPVLTWQKYYDDTFGLIPRIDPSYLGTGSAGTDTSSSSASQDKKTELELAKLGEKVQKTQNAFIKTQEAIKNTQEAIESVLKDVATQKTELDTSKQAWEKETNDLKSLVEVMKKDIEAGKEDLKKAKTELESNKIKVIETLGIFTALFALITNASNGWSPPMFIAFVATIFSFLFLSHYLLTGNEKILSSAMPIFRYSVLLTILAIGIYIGNNWKSWIPQQQPREPIQSEDTSDVPETPTSLPASPIIPVGPDQNSNAQPLSVPSGG